jgi:exodeoxyribonuclease V alpha subunit
VRAGRIVAAWAEQKAVREIMVFLHAHGVGTSRAVRIFKTYGANAIQVMTDNPYRLARDIRGIGFKTADAIAERLGIERRDRPRARRHLLRASRGHRRGALRPAEGRAGLAAERLLEVPAELIGTALDFELAEGTVVADRVGDNDCVFLAGCTWPNRRSPSGCCACGRARRPGRHRRREGDRLGVGAHRPDARAEPGGGGPAGAGLQGHGDHGGPGVGKTTIVNAILRVLAAKGVRMLLAAPTGRAAKRMTEATGLEAKTLHRLLEADPATGGFKRDADTRSTATCWWWTRPRWWTCRSPMRC